MSLICLSTTHYTSPLSLREKLAAAAASLQVSLARRADHPLADWPPLAELTVLSTCNRVEVYAVGEGHPTGLVPLLAGTAGIDLAALESHLLQYSDDAAAHHLCRVAAGLDSMVLGESEILGQVGEAHAAAASQGASGPTLAALFRVAMRAGKRARTETAIGRGRGSVSSVAVDLAAQVMGGLAGRSVVVVGAGRMARKTVTVLRATGVSELVILSRTREAAESLARELGAVARGFGDLAAALAEADLVISSTGSAEPVITLALVHAVMAERSDPLVVVDIAMPRDVEPGVGKIDHVHLFDLDGLRARLDESSAERRKAIPEVEAIVAEEVVEFHAWRTGAGMRPVLGSL